MDVERAVAYVQAHGNSVDQARLAATLWDERPSERVRGELAAFQNPDGGFAYRLQPGQVSTVGNTAFALRLYDDLKVHRGATVERACRFLLDHQQEDAGWDEVEAVRALDLPEWRTPGRIETRVWLTAYCAHMLLRFGYAEAEGTRCPTDFLLAHRDETGRLTGYLRATWIALPMLAFYPGPHTKPFRQALAFVDASFSPNWAGSTLAWLLRCLGDAGLPADHPLVSRCLAELERKQRPDGSWESEDGEGKVHAAGATVEALRALNEYGVIRERARRLKRQLPRSLHPRR
jgi:hypothetical protein